jgi:hypothetical protein
MKPRCPKIPVVTKARLACASIVLGTTVVGVAWLANYRADMLVVAQRRGVDPLPLPSGTLVHGPVWWGAYTATTLLLVGAGLALRVLGKRLLPAQRTSELLLQRVPFTRPRLPVRQLTRTTLGGLDWLVVEPLRFLVKR